MQKSQSVGRLLATTTRLFSGLAAAEILLRPCQSTRRSLRTLLLMVLVMAGAWAADPYIWIPLGDQGRAPSSLRGVTAISAGGAHTAALKLDGTVVVWGNNGVGQASVPAGLTGVMAVAAGGGHTLALKQDGTVAAWGDNSGGQSTIPSGLTGVTTIAAGQFHSVALTQDGTVMAWGNNSKGQTTIPADLAGVKAISAGYAHTVALKQDGTVVGWGLNDHGQTTIPPGLNGVTAIAAGRFFTVALKADGAVVAWGDIAVTTVPVGLIGVTAIAAGGWHSVALKQDGTVVAWGDSSTGVTTIPTDLNEVTAIAAGSNHTVTLKSDGTVVGWGYISAGLTTAPAGLTGLRIAPGLYHNVALKEGGTVVAWGRNDFGQATIPPGLSGVEKVAVGYHHTLALKPDRTVLAWGDDFPNNYPTPAGRMTQIVAGQHHSVAVMEDKSVVMWGIGNNLGRIPVGLRARAIATGDNFIVALGRLDSAPQTDVMVAWGDNSSGQTAIPVGLTGVTDISAASTHTLALKNDGTVVSWGADYASVPAGLTGVTSISAGRYHNVALKSGGTVVAWGDNSYGQTTIPVDLTGVIDIAAGGDQSWVRAPSRLANPVTITNSTVTYDGQPHTLAISTANGRTPTTTTYSGLYTPPGDVGTYTVVSEADYMDSYGSATGTLTIAPAPPVFINQPGNQSATVGEAAMFTVMVAGSPTLDLQWQRSDDLGISWNTIPGATSTGYKIYATLIGDNGARFRCQANNILGGTTSNIAILSVQQATQTIAFADPGPQTYGTGPLLLSATASSLLPVSFFVASGPATIAGSTLTITGAGSIAVTAYQSGNANYLGAFPVQRTITVQKANQTITFTGPGTQTYGVAPLTLTATASSSLAVTFSVIDGPATVIGSTLTINGAGSVVVAADQVGDSNYLAASRMLATIIVNPAAIAPIFTAQPSDQTVSIGQTANFFIAVRGTPDPAFQWLRSDDGGTTWNLVPGAVATMYVLTSTRTSDNGAMFTCMATNSAGSATSSAATLTVTTTVVAPAITTQPANQSVTVGQTATFTVAASGSPTPTFQWQRSNDGTTWNVISGATGLSYTTAATATGDNGAQFRCIAVNSAGSATSVTATLTVVSPPSGSSSSGGNGSSGGGCGLGSGLGLLGLAVFLLRRRAGGRSPVDESQGFSRR